MRKLLVVFIVLGAVMSTSSAQDASPETRLKELERRLKKLEDEAADLRREIEKLKGESLPEGVLWQLDMRSDLKGSGAIADLDGDGKLQIVFGSYFGEQHLFCVDAATGSVLWKHKSDAGPLDASVAIHDFDGDGKLEIFSADSSSGHLYDLSAKGDLNWKFKLPNSTDSPPAIADLEGDGVNELIVGSMWQRDGKGAIGCYTAKEQKLLWERKYKGCIQSEPVLVDLNADKVLDVIVTTWRGDNGIHAIDGKTGDALWTFTTAGDDKSMGMYHGVALSGDEKTIYMATCQGDVYALDRKGKQVWHKHYDDYLFAPITVADVNGDDREDLIFGGRSLYCLAADGAQQWSVKLDSSLDRGVAVTDADGDGDMDVLFADHRALVARDGKSGDETFRFDATYKGEQWEDISSAPLVADFDGDGLCEAFLVIGQGTSTDQFKNNYGRAVAVKLKGKGPAWTTFRSNLRRTGNPKHND
ncbi:MAG: PQQ-binding-like beta-propeller repeat protein [Planctomycetes bacterium]|nr:PQQ-binding-like beta-propeller repeat protein [Planctomycetota bacterium]